MSPRQRDRRGRLIRTEIDPTQIPPADQVGPVIPSLRFTVESEDKGPYPFDLTYAQQPEIAMAIGHAIQDRCKEEKIRAGTLRNYDRYIRRLDDFLGGRYPDHRLALADLEADAVDDFEQHLRDSGLTTTTPYNTVVIVVALLRYVRDELPQWRMTESLKRRLGYGANGDEGKHLVVPTSGYEGPELRALVQACKGTIRQIVERRTTGELELAEGRDPRVHGWDKDANVLWYIANVGPLDQPTLASVMGSERVARPSVYWSVFRRLNEIHLKLFPADEDWVPFAVLLAIRTGIEPESLRDLDVTCLGPDTNGLATLQYYKPRAHRTIELRVRTTGRYSVGGLLRLALEVSRHARAQVPEGARTKLWLKYRSRAAKRPRLDVQGKRFLYEVLDGFVEQHKLLGNDGNALVLTLQRARKTYDALRYHRARGAITEAAGDRKTLGTFADHYGDTPALRDLHERSIVRAASRAADIVNLKTKSEVRLNGAGSADASDESWLAHCKDPSASPFRKSGFCGDPFLGCLDCPCAIITPDKLPALFAALNKMLRLRFEEQMAEWEPKFGRPFSLIIAAIFPRFTSEELIAARAIAEKDADLAFLPPEFYSSGI